MSTSTKTFQVTAGSTTFDVRLDAHFPDGVWHFTMWLGPDEVATFRLLPDGTPQGYSMTATNRPIQASTEDVEDIIEQTRRLRPWEG